MASRRVYCGWPLQPRVGRACWHRSAVVLPLRRDAAAQPPGDLLVPRDGGRALRHPLPRDRAAAGTGLAPRGGRAPRQDPGPDRPREADRHGRVARALDHLVPDERRRLVGADGALPVRRVAFVPRHIVGRRDVAAVAPTRLLPIWTALTRHRPRTFRGCTHRDGRAPAADSLLRT